MLQFCVLEAPHSGENHRHGKEGFPGAPDQALGSSDAPESSRRSIVHFGNGETEALAWLHRCCQANTFLWFFSTSKGWLLEFYLPRCLLTGLGWRE